jgi:hypothetical protein
MIALAGVLLASLECGGSTEPKTGPVPGALVVTLATPNTDDAAILLTVTGPAAPTSVTPQTGLRLFQGGGLGATSHLVLTGALGNGPILTLQVADVNVASSYHATIQSVASTDYVLRTVAAYSLTVAQ